LSGQTTSQLGAPVSGVAIPLLAVLTLQASPLQLGLVTALAFALIGLPAGAANVVLIQALTFAASAASLVAIKTRDAEIPRHPDRPRLRTQIKEGLVLAELIGIRATLWLSAAIITSPHSLYSALRGTRDVEDLPPWT
jgi:hypothetical protein